MGAGCDFRNDAAEIRVKIGLARDDRGQNPAVARYNRGGGVVAAAFDAKENCVVHTLAGR